MAKKPPIPVSHATILTGLDDLFKKMAAEVDVEIEKFRSGSDEKIKSVMNWGDACCTKASTTTPKQSGGADGVSSAEYNRIRQIALELSDKNIELNKTVEDLKRRLNLPKSLPWFKHGIKGFLSKLWYGNHESNPMWSRYSKTEAHILPLEEYNKLQNEVDGAVTIILFETKQGQEDKELNALVNDLKDSLVKIINKYGRMASSMVRNGNVESEIVKAHLRERIKKENPGISDADLEKRVKEEHDETQSWVSWKEGFEGRIDPEYLIRAIQLMEKMGLDPNNPEDVRKVFPTHSHAIINYRQADDVAASAAKVEENKKAKKAKTPKK